MVLFNHATREMTAKIVYYGPGLCGKTTNLLVIFDKLDPKNRGKMLSLATKTDRTLFFDLLPVDIGKVGAFNLRIQLYTVPGQVFYNETRKLVLKGADAVVFVVDSQGSMAESNRESFQNLLENLEQNQIDANDIPIIVQFNKRDLPNVLDVEELQEKLGLDGYPHTEAAAIKGEGVMETFKLASKITAKHLISRLQGKPAPPLKDTKAAAAKGKKEKEKKGGKSVPPPPTFHADPVQTESNPFADSFPGGDGAPFGESSESAPFGEPAASVAEQYESIEEVPLDSLLEGRPLTFSGNVAVPADDEVEHLGTEHLVDHGATAVAIEEEEPIPFSPSKMRTTFAEEAAARGSDLRTDVQALQKEMAELRKKHEELLKGITRISEDLRRLASQ